MRKALIKVLQLLIFVACSIYLIHFFIENRATIRIAFNLDMKLLAVILILHPIFYALQSWRLKIVIEKCSNKSLPFWPMLKIYILTRFLNTLFSQTGNVYSGIRLKKDFGVTYTKYISGHTSTAWIDLDLNLIVAIIVIILLYPELSIGKYYAWKFLSMSAVLVTLLPFLVYLIIRQITFHNKYLIWLHTKLSEAIATSINIFKDPFFLLKMSVLGVLLFIRTSIVFSIYFLCFDIHVNLAAITVFYVLFKLSSFILITPGNLGVQEVVWGFLSEQMGVGMVQGVLVSTLTRIVGTTCVLLMGLTLGGADLIRKRWEYKPDIPEQQRKRPQ